MRLCRFKSSQNEEPRPGLLLDKHPGEVVDLSSLGVERLSDLLEANDLATTLRDLGGHPAPRHPLAAVQLCSPAEEQEVWAAGVTYLRSKTARMEESDFSASAYDRVYAAERPEIFFKALGEKSVGPDAPVGIRSDARWSVPEPELALVLNSQGTLAGCTVGNDMSSRDIEGENLLYLPQAKIYEGSCALGPWIVTGVTEAEARTWTVDLEIVRAGKTVFSGNTRIDQIKRRFDELAGFLFRSQRFPRGAVLLTGTGIVPPDTFTLAEGDRVNISISGIGRLSNPVLTV